MNMVKTHIIAYSAWAVYSGLKVIFGRSEWLNTKLSVDLIVKNYT